MYCTLPTFWARSDGRKRSIAWSLLVVCVLWMGTASSAAAGQPEAAASSAAAAGPIAAVASSAAMAGPIAAVASSAGAAGPTAAPSSAGAAWRSTAATTPLVVTALTLLQRQDFPDDLPYALQRSTEEFVNRELVRSTALYFTCFGIYLLIGLIFLTYWRWMRRDLPVLAVGLLSLLMAVHTAAISGSMIFLFPDIVDPYTRGMIESVSYLLLNGFIAFMLWAFFPDAFRPARADWIHMLNWTIVGTAVLTSVLFAVAAPVLGGETVVYVLSASRWIMALLMIVVVALGLQALETRADFSLVTVSGLALIVVGSLHDVLFAGGGAGDRPYMITFAVLGFVLLQSYVMMRRSAAAARRDRLSSSRLRREVHARTKELRAASIAAEAANMAKTEIVTAVTHELRTPLTSMLGYTELLREELGDNLSPRHREFLSIVRLSGERLLKLVNDLLDLARIEAGRIEVIAADVDVAELVSEVKNQLYPLAARKNLYLREEILSETPVARADADRLRQVLINLVSNAIKFTSTGGVTMRVTDAELKGAPAVRIEVSDTGAGVSPDFIPQLFERFTREESKALDEPTGSGLGLRIAREITGYMHGELTVESVVGEGSSFNVVLPHA